MEPSKMEDFVANAALLAAHLTDQCNKAATAQQAAARDLQAAALSVERAIDEGKRDIGEQTRSAVHDALAQEIPAAAHRIGETAARLRQMADHLHQEQARLAQRARFLGWKSLAVLSVACVTLVAGSMYAAWHNLQRAEQAKVDAEVLEALQHVTITSCGGHPCIRLQDGLTRWQKNDQYVLIDTSGDKESGAASGR